MASRRRKKKQYRDKALSEAVSPPVSWESSEGENFANTPFANLKKMLKEARSPVRPERTKGEKRSTAPPKPQAPARPCAIPNKPSEMDDKEYQLFLQEMRDVQPASWKKKTADSIKPGAATPAINTPDEEEACRKELEDIVRGKREIPVEHTPEYAEGPEINSNPRIVRKLRRGKFSVQSYCDLHGLTVREAMEWCEEFMKRSIAADRSCIAIIHGRGLSSPKGPVLKKMVHEWLTKGRWRRHIIAYSSAPNWDGGPGVTYVLLRQKPAPRKKRKKRRLWKE